VKTLNVLAGAASPAPGCPGTSDVTVAQRGLRYYRLRAGLTQEELADRTGLSVRGVANIECGRVRRPHASSLHKLAEVLGLSAEEQTVFVRRQVRHRNLAGRWLWVEVTNAVDASDPAMVNTDMILIDRPADDRTSVSNELLRHLAEALPFGIAQIDSDRRIVFSNGKLDDVCGQIDGDHLDDRFTHLLPADLTVLDAAVKSVLAGEDSEIELSVRHPRRGVRRCGVILSALAGRSGYGTTGALLCVTDITDDVQERLR
jgi:transcriptional regulator with XRE-family HTH domain